MENSAYFKRTSSYCSKWRWGTVVPSTKEQRYSRCVCVKSLSYILTQYSQYPLRVRAWGRIVGGRCACAGAGGRQRRCSLSVSPARRRGALRHAALRLLVLCLLVVQHASILLLSCRIVSWVCVYSVVPGSLSLSVVLLLLFPARSKVMHPPTPSPHPTPLLSCDR